jgi:anti-sigma factor RsiW
MDCKQCREMLDCHLDGELSAEASAAMDAHLAECAACARTLDRLQSLRLNVRRTVMAQQPPPGLESRIRWAIKPTTARLLERRTAGGVPLWLAAAAAILLTVAGVTASASHLRSALVATLDQAVVGLSTPETVVLEGTVLCRDCDLKKQHGVRTLCERIGHRGSLVTADGRLWNIVEQDSSAVLVHDPALLGRKVRVRATIFRTSGSITIEAFEILG